jgi:peroxiredoxin
MFTDRSIPNVIFLVREGKEFFERTTEEMFSGKKIFLFSVVGAFSPYCEIQLKEFEKWYDAIIELGYDDVYCISVNDTLVMNKWGKENKIEKIKMIPDGSGIFTKFMGMIVRKDNIGFGERSWRYISIIDDMKIEKIIEEPYKRDNASEDPFVLTNPDAIIKFLLYGEEPIYKSGNELGANDIDPNEECTIYSSN